MRRIGLLCLLAASALAHPHNAPTIWADLHIEPGEVRIVVTALRELVTEWLDKKVNVEDPMAADDVAQAQVALGAYFRQKNRVTIDGVRVYPGVRTVQPPANMQSGEEGNYLEMTLVFACAQPPRQVAVRWETFEGALWNEQKIVPGLAKHLPHVDVMAYSPEEPEYIWHATGVRPARVAEVTTEPPPGWPLWSGAALALALLGGLALRRRRGWALAWVGAGLIAAFLLRDRVWARPVTPPSDEQAREIFQTLHQNIYRAFDAATEDEIYALLAASVDRALLDDLYGDIYESLILRGQGGAVTQVEGVEVLDGHVDFPATQTTPPNFSVDWKWRLRCAVTHWGHTHRRVTAYDARYVVRHDGRSWKIYDVEERAPPQVEVSDD